MSTQPRSTATPAEPARRAVRWAAVLAWMSLIFFLSAQPDLPNLSPGLPGLEEIGGHLAEYAVLALLLRWALAGEGMVRAGATALLACVLYGVSDEIHQAFVPGRTPDIRDLAMDALGAAAVLSAAWAYLARREPGAAGAVSGRDFRNGVRDCLPVVAGYLAIGLAFGVLARTAGLSILEVTLMSAILYAGSAQFVAAGLLGAGASGMAIVLTILLVNIRHLLYSAAMLPHLSRPPVWKNLVIGAELTDETFALASGYLAGGRRASRAWLFGINLTAHASWVVSTALGALLGDMVARVSFLGLDFALPAMFAALLVLQIANGPHVRLAITVALVGAVVAVAGGMVMSQSWALVLAVLVGGSLGVVLERRLWK